ncbi:MAG TPA: fatty acid desaturase [Rhizomicrobium sp.]|nr:fatty acid desaturase [Rhizomicrobium sp.]
MSTPLSQTYAPFRKTLLSVGQLESLNRLRPARVVRDTLFLWAQILLTWTFVALWPAWWSVLLAMPLIGTRYYALFIIGHDGLHRRLFTSRRWNDAWNDIFVMGAIGAITRLNRQNHMTHHMTLGLAHDPDRYKYLADDKSTPASLIFSLTGLRYVLRALGNVFLPRQRISEDGYGTRDWLILLGWQAALIGGLSWAIGWWAYPLLWLLPVYFFTFTADIVRVFLEHSHAEPDARSDMRSRLISFTSSPVERRFFAPLNMNLHAAHHLWPSIPYYNLPAADGMMRAALADNDSIIWRASYCGYLLSFARSFRG